MTFMPWVLDRLYALADAQVGHFTAGQAAEVGVDRRYLAHHVRSGNLERVDRGIYRLRNYPSRRFEDVMVAILWAGKEAVASHETALAIYGLADAMPGVIHLTTDRRFRGSRRGVIVHQAHLAEGDVTWRDGIPVTTPLRTVTDVAADQSVAMAAVTEAIERGLIRTHQLREAAEDRPVLAELLSRMSSE
jgi:predicted transcriptional regulator of viral defense system